MNPITFNELEEMTISLENDLKVFNDFLEKFDDFTDDNKFDRLHSAMISMNVILSNSSRIKALRKSQQNLFHEFVKKTKAEKLLSQSNIN